MSREMFIATVLAATLVIGGVAFVLSRQPSERGVPAAQPVAGEPSADQVQQLQDRQTQQSQAGEPGTTPR